MCYNADEDKVMLFLKESIIDWLKLNWIVLTPSAVNQIAITGHAPLQKWKLREL